MGRCFCGGGGQLIIANNAVDFLLRHYNAIVNFPFGHHYYCSETRFFLIQLLGKLLLFNNQLQNLLFQKNETLYYNRCSSSS